MSLMILTVPVFVLLLDASQPQQMYRWRDAQGIEHVTNTPPPNGAKTMGLPAPENTKDADPAPPEAAPNSPKEDRAAIESTLSESQKSFWRNIEARIRKARSAGDTHALHRIAETILFDALWGQGLWAVMGLPLILLVMGVLFG